MNFIIGFEKIAIKGLDPKDLGKGLLTVGVPAAAVIAGYQLAHKAMGKKTREQLHEAQTSEEYDKHYAY